MSEYHSIDYQRFHLEYKIIGNGNTPLLAFHGYNNEASDFEVFEDTLGKKYTIYSFNLFHHGNSAISDSKDIPMSKEEFRELIAAFLKKHQIKRFKLIGFSLGGKNVLTLTEFFDHQIDGIYLLAPDGIKMSAWYNLVSRNKIGGMIYRFLIHRPQPFYWILKSLRVSRIIHKKTYKFLMTEMGSKENRQKIYDVWVTYAAIEPNLKQIQKNIHDKSIPVVIVVGDKDPLIKPKIGERFLNLIDGNGKMHILKGGHKLLSKRTNELFRKLLSK